MSIWGVEGGTVDEERLKPLGLICYGGRSSDKNGTTYHVCGKNGFDVYLNKQDFDNVGDIYKKFKNDLRKDK